MARPRFTMMASLVIALLANVSHADLVAEWVGFGGGFPVPATGGAQQSTAELDVLKSTRGSFSAVRGDELTLSGNHNGWETAALDLSFSGDLFDDFVLSFDVEGNSSGGGPNPKLPPDAIDWYLSVDGGDFSYVDTNTIGLGTNVGQTLDLTGNLAANAASSLLLRARFLNPANGNGPSLVFDNITINAVAVPEPSSFWFLGLAGVLGSCGYASRGLRRWSGDPR
jgi:hypothetical protein